MEDAIAVDYPYSRNTPENIPPMKTILAILLIIALGIGLGVGIAVFELSRAKWTPIVDEQHGDDPTSSSAKFDNPMSEFVIEFA